MAKQPTAPGQRGNCIGFPFLNAAQAHYRRPRHHPSCEAPAGERFPPLSVQIDRGKVNPGQSQAELEYLELVKRINQPSRGVYKIAFVSLKGGVGKTTAAKTVGSTFASLRGDRVIAIDANPMPEPWLIVSIASTGTPFETCWRIITSAPTAM
ncbi:hypothetical protein GCM10020255_006000 [Rhodococcus baikonurensis]